MTQLRKTDMGILFATLVITLAMILLLATPGHTQETTATPEEFTVAEETTATPEEFTAAQETTTPSTAEDTAQASGQQGECRVVETFTGSGETRTDTPFFEIVGPQWRVVYETVNTAPPPLEGIFGFFIRNERGDALDNGVEIRGDNSGIKNVNSDPGQYYLQIISAEVDWTLRVEDCGSPNEGTTDFSNRQIQDLRDEVQRDTIVGDKLVETGGPAILAPAVVLLFSGATVVLFLTRRQ